MIILNGKRASGCYRPATNRQIASGDALNAGAPVLATADRLSALAIDVTDVGHGRVLFQYLADVLDAQTRRTAVAGAHTVHARGTRQHHQQVRAEALNLGFDRGARALPDRDHCNQRGHSDEHAEHGQAGAQFVASNCTQGSQHGHPTDRAGFVEQAIEAAAKSALSIRLYRRQRAGCAAPGGVDGRYIGNNLSIAKRDDSIRKFRQIPLVSHQHHRHAALQIQGTDGCHDVERVLRIEIPGGFVRQHDGRIVDQRTSDGDALLLSTG